ncbi:hypothetical protein FRC15_004305 [Serendipita sp. 397]|nr:hypothetical protein FRC15_004305 [Serendipita sp. 397]
MRKIRLAYLKLSDVAIQRLLRAFSSWVDGESMEDYDFGTEVVGMPGYMLISTTGDHANPSTTDAYEQFERDQHIGNLPGAVDNLRHYFDQRFTQGRQPPRQHALNALAHYYVRAGEIESARQVATEAMDTARTVSDRRTLMNVTSLARRIPPRKQTKSEDDTKSIDDDDAAIIARPKYTTLQVGTSPMDLLFDVRLGLDAGEPLSFLFQKRFEAIGAFDLPPDIQMWPLETQWQIWAIDAQLWRLAGMASVAEIADKIVLANTSPKDDIRLFTLCITARQHFLRGQYAKAFMVLLDRDTWAQLSLTQFGYWSEQIWWLMWDIATRRSQDAFKLQFLEARKPHASPFDVSDKAKKSPEAIRKMILEASEALTARNVTRATILIVDALHHAEVNGYWHLYRSATPIFADLELQRGKIESARKRIEEILPQVARGEDLEQRAMTYAIYAKVKMAKSHDTGRGAHFCSPGRENCHDGVVESLSEALVYLKKAEDDYQTLEIYSSVQDMLYLQAVVHETLEEPTLRDLAGKRLREIEEVEEKMRVGSDEEMTEVWDVVCEIGIAVARGDTYWP